MRQLFGILFLILALLGVFGSVRALTSDPPKATGNKSYDAGQRAGQKLVYVSPFLFGGIAWILLSGFSISMPRSSTPARAGGAGGNSKTVLIVIASVIGGMILMVVLVVIGLFILGWMRSRPRTRPPQFTPQIQHPATVPQSGTRSTNVVHMSGQPDRIGSYEVGTKVEANWGGRWTPGKVTRLNFGGHSLFVQLEDSRYPHPLVLSTNMIRPAK